jgi:valyl-tRNA synthetase
VPLEGILDKDKEIDKLTKEIDKTSKFIFGLEKKLSNAKFVSNAPAAVVDGEKNKLANQQDILVKAQKALAELQ